LKVLFAVYKPNRGFYKIFSGTWQEEVDEFCLSSDRNMISQIAEREVGWVEVFKLEKED
jgi:hypothetical protein